MSSKIIMEKQFACIKNSIVENIIVIDDENVDFIEEYKELHNYDLLIESSLNAERGGEYDGELFWKVPQYPSWVKNYETNSWEAPIPYPYNEEYIPYEWNEDILNWEEIQVSE
jgi:hypothetical protein